MALNYIYVSVTGIILRRGQQCKVCFSVAVGAGGLKVHTRFSDCHNFTSRPAVYNVFLCSSGDWWQ